MVVKSKESKVKTIPSDPDEIVVDNTLLSDMVCDTKVAVRHILGLTTKTEAAALKCGQCVHHAMAVFLAGGDAAEAMVAFRTTYKKWADVNVEPTDRLAWDNASRCMQAWLKDHPLPKLPFIPMVEYIEHPVSMPLGVVSGKKVRFVGILDAAGHARASAGLYVIDHKSTKRPDDWWEARQKTSAQFTGYMVLAEHVFNKPVSGVFVNGIGLPQLNSSDKKCSKHGVPYYECATAPEHLKHKVMVVTRNKNQMEAWEETVHVLAGQYIELREYVDLLRDVPHLLQQGTFRGHCVNCEMSDFCRLGRTTHAAKTLLRESRWDPEAHAAERAEFVKSRIGGD